MEIISGVANVLAFSQKNINRQRLGKKHVMVEQNSKKIKTKHYVFARCLIKTKTTFNHHCGLRHCLQPR